MRMNVASLMGKRHCHIIIRMLRDSSAPRTEVNPARFQGDSSVMFISARGARPRLTIMITGRKVDGDFNDRVHASYHIVVPGRRYALHELKRRDNVLNKSIRTLDPGHGSRQRDRGSPRQTRALINPISVIALQPVFGVPAIPINGTAIASCRQFAGRGQSARHWLRLGGRGALPGLIRPIALSPFPILLTLPINEAAVVYIRRRASHRLRGRHWLRLGGRGALIVLIRPIAVDPFLVALALVINEATIVDLRCRLLRSSWLAAVDAAEVHPVRQPNFASVVVDLQPAIELADHLQQRARSDRFGDIGI